MLITHRQTDRQTNEQVLLKHITSSCQGDNYYVMCWNVVFHIIYFIVALYQIIQIIYFEKKVRSVYSRVLHILYIMSRLG